jgi:hypothetical protein
MTTGKKSGFSELCWGTNYSLPFHGKSGRTESSLRPRATIRSADVAVDGPEQRADDGLVRVIEYRLHIARQSQLLRQHRHNRNFAFENADRDSRYVDGKRVFDLSRSILVTW